jgi:hypothetical protein
MTSKGRFKVSSFCREGSTNSNLKPIYFHLGGSVELSEFEAIGGWNTQVIASLQLTSGRVGPKSHEMNEPAPIQLVQLFPHC